MEHILNILLAGWCGDAVGARLEFRRMQFPSIDVTNAMHFVGESTTNVCIGQVTDDSEMEMALLHAIIENGKDEYFPLDIIAKKYIEWYHSKPFDIGNTTQNALLNATDEITMMQNASDYNIKSESNGSLMRCAGLAICCWYRSSEIIFSVTEMEASLTHLSPVIHQITGIYCNLIATMLRNHILGLPQNKPELLKSIITYATNAKVKTWVTEGLTLVSLDTYDAIKNCGHVKHVFVMIVYFLNNIEKYTYEKAILETLMCGGDTDTNAKIIGNLFGAYYTSCVPDYMLEPVLQFDCTQVKEELLHFKRPQQYSVKRMIETINDNKHIFLNN